jgi:hypothetical protein
MEPVETPLDRTIAVNQFWSSHDDSLHPQAALVAITDLSDAYFERGRWAGFGPRFLKIGRRVRYRKRDVMDWLENRETAQEKLQAGVQPASGVISPKKLRQARAEG